MSNKKKYLIIGALSTLVLMLGVTLAYFTPIIRGEGETMTVYASDLKIIFTDTSEIIVEDEILPGWSTSKSFTVENQSDETYYYDISMKEFINTFVLDYLEYKITSTNGYNMEEYKPLPKSKEEVIAHLNEGISIEVGESHTYTISFRYKDDPEVNQSEDMNKTFEGVISITEGRKESFEEGTLAIQLKKDNPSILGRVSFDGVFTQENVGTLFKASGSETEDIDDDGLGENVYYFAGNAQNNWIKFGKDQDNADLYWRIIRTNEDGGVRLLYIGPDPATESALISIDGTLQDKIAYNIENKNPRYVGYMYNETQEDEIQTLEIDRQNTTSSNIKTVTDEWYSKTLLVNKDSSENTYDSYVSKTAIYCNDRSGDGYKTTGLMYFATYRRLYSGKSPSYRCGVDVSRNLFKDVDVRDKFSVSTTSGGNGDLQYGIAQITADELAYAGGKILSNAQTWYYYNSENGPAVSSSSSWWTMTPIRKLATYMVVTPVRGVGNMLLNFNLASLIGVRPVLSLKSCVKYVSGDGSSSSPYEVSVDSTCASLEN